MNSGIDFEYVNVFVDQYLKLYDQMNRIGLDIKTENNGNRVVIYQKSKSKKTDIAIATIHLDDTEREVEFHFTPCLHRMGKKPNHKRNIKKDWRFNIQTLVDSAYYFYANVKDMNRRKELGSNPIVRRYESK